MQRGDAIPSPSFLQRTSSMAIVSLQDHPVFTSQHGRGPAAGEGEEEKGVKGGGSARKWWVVVPQTLRLKSWHNLFQLAISLVFWL